MKKIFLVGILFILYSCSSAKYKNEEPSAALQDLITDQSFRISSQWANPQMSVTMSQFSAIRPSGSVGARIDIRGKLLR